MYIDVVCESPPSAHFLPRSIGALTFGPIVKNATKIDKGDVRLLFSLCLNKYDAFHKIIQLFSAAFSHEKRHAICSVLQ